MPRPAEPLLPALNGLTWLPGQLHGHMDVLNRLTCGQALLGSCAGASRTERGLLLSRRSGPADCGADLSTLGLEGWGWSAFVLTEGDLPVASRQGQKGGHKM